MAEHRQVDNDKQMNKGEKMKTKNIIITLAIAMAITACGSAQDAGQLHEKLVAAGKMQISETRGFSISSYVPGQGGSSAELPQVSNGYRITEESYKDCGGAATEELAPENGVTETLGKPNQEIPNKTTISKDAGSTTMYVVFQDSTFSIEKDGVEILAGEWNASGTDTIIVSVNGSEHELRIEMVNNKIALSVPGNVVENIASSDGSSVNGYSFRECGEDGPIPESSPTNVK